MSGAVLGGDNVYCESGYRGAAPHSAAPHLAHRGVGRRGYDWETLSTLPLSRRQDNGLPLL